MSIGLWIPAFAGMTDRLQGMTDRLEGRLIGLKDD